MKYHGIYLSLALVFAEKSAFADNRSIRGNTLEAAAADAIDVDAKYWDRFLQVQSSMDTSAPSSAPSSSLSASPTAAPVLGTPPPTPVITTASPTTAPVGITTSAPTSAPVDNGTSAPTSAPVDNGTSAPTSAPIVSITPAPTAQVVPATPSPTASPVVTATPSPTTAPVATAAPTVAPVVTAAPTAAPVSTASPTAAPTPTPQAPVVQQRLTPFALQGGAEWADPESYQSKALLRTEEQVGAEGFTDAKLVQYYALYSIYNATNMVPNPLTDSEPQLQGRPVPGWLIATGWETNNLDPCDGWFGITCDAQGRVTRFVMVNNVLTGSFPPEVMLLASDGPRATGAGNLNYLELFNNIFLFNNFDNSWMTNLGSNLQFLYVGQTGFSGDIPLLPSGLIEVDFGFSLIDGGLADSNFGQSTALEYINFAGNAFNTTVPSIFSTYQNLEFLYLADSFISGDLSYMQGMPSIFEHWIDQNPGFGGPIFDFIGGLSTLASFSVTQSALTGTIPAALGQLNRMEQLWFYDNLLTGQIPTELGLLVTMNRLQVEGNAFTGIMPTEVCANAGFLGRLAVVGADCNDVNFECSCCTCCNLQECNPDESF